jgi:hypothetical protein
MSQTPPSFEPAPVVPPASEPEAHVPAEDEDHAVDVLTVPDYQPRRGRGRRRNMPVTTPGGTYERRDLVAEDSTPVTDDKAS